MRVQVQDLLQRVRATGTCDNADVELLARNGCLRDEVYRTLLADPQPQDCPLLCSLLDYEIEEHELHDALSDNMVICAYLLAIQRRVKDAPRLWAAKMANFSTFLGLSTVLLVAGGIDETIAYWEKEKGWFVRRPAASVLSVIKQARAKGNLEDLGGRLAEIRTYCEKSLNSRIT